MCVVRVRSEKTPSVMSSKRRVVLDELRKKHVEGVFT